MIYGDTSFYFSLYGNDPNSGRAVAYMKRCREALRLSPLNSFELGNALRFAVFRKVLPEKEAKCHWIRFETAIKQGRLVVTQVNLAQVIAEAERLSALHTMERGYRSFDILHVGAALVLGTDTFLSFDKNQCRLAKSEGLRIPL